jgi:hypothetical protein
MSQNEGEKELVLGNKQLLGIFFVATLLCGVFFAMGYVVGSNASKERTGTTASDSSPVSSNEGKREEPPARDKVLPTPADAASVQPAPDSKISDNPAAAGSQPAAAVPAPIAQVTPSPVASSPSAAATASSQNSDANIAVPDPGASYLQVTAMQRPAADAVIKSLRDKNLPAILAESSKADYYRVLVGPYRSQLQLADAKNKLKDLGYGNIIVHKQ